MKMVNFFYKIFPFFSEGNTARWVREQLNSIPTGETILDAGAGECKYKNTVPI